MPDDEVRFRITLEMQKSLAEAARLTKLVEEIKTGITLLSKQSGQSFDAIAAGIKRSNEELKKTSKLVQDAWGKPIAGGKRMEDKAVSFANQQVTKALRELNAEERKHAAVVTQASQQIKQAKQQEFQLEQNLVRQRTIGLKESQAAQAEYVRVTQQGYGVMSDAAKRYGEQAAQKVMAYRNTDFFLPGGLC